MARHDVHAIFLFIALVMGVIVLFAVVNTMTMNVWSEPTKSAPFARWACRNGIRAQFAAEGSLIGAIGATVVRPPRLPPRSSTRPSDLVPPGNAILVLPKCFRHEQYQFGDRSWIDSCWSQHRRISPPAVRHDFEVDALRHV
jgi:hypothetical protein